MSITMVHAVMSGHWRHPGMVFVAQDYPGRMFTLTYIDGSQESARVTKKVLDDLPIDGVAFTGRCEDNVSWVQS